MAHTVVVLLFTCISLFFACSFEADIDQGPDGKIRSKRLVMDSEIDVYSEVQILKAQVQALTSQLEAQNLKFEALKTKTVVASTYIHWGRRRCSNTTDFVYDGYIAGSKYNDPGSGSDSQCLPSDPTWNRYSTTSNFYRANIYGAELDAFAASHIFLKDVGNEDMPCSVCRTSFPTTMVFPARADCYQGWTLQYSGYLVANLAGSGRTSYQSICIDQNPDFIPNSQADDNEHVLYLIDAQCGSLPCPPYIQNAELACAVCSK